MPQLPLSDPSSSAPTSRAQLLLSGLCLFLAVVFAPAGRRELFAAAAQLVQWVVGDASTETASPSSPTPADANPNQRLITALQAVEGALQRHAEQNSRSASGLSPADPPAQGPPPAAATAPPATASRSASPPSPAPNSGTQGAPQTTVVSAPPATTPPCGGAKSNRLTGEQAEPSQTKVYRLRSLPGD
jgi:hypothetical protein